MALSVENLCGLLMRSRLLSQEAVKSTYQRWLTEAKDGAADVGQFTRWLVASQLLTEYQAALIARGRTDGFFIGEYKILDRLCTGRLAGAFKAVHRLGPVVAVRVLPPSLAKDPARLARFQQEARQAVRLKHPNLVRTFHAGQAGGIHYLVLEYLEGETLEEVLRRRGPLAPAEAVRLIYQALQGLQHLHEQGLTHGDLQPANLLPVPAAPPGGPETTRQAAVKILDHGPDPSLVGDAGKETEGGDKATPSDDAPSPYRAPEQARAARPADIRADIYSLGCVLYHALAGQPPAEPPRPLQELNPAVPDGLQQIVNWMTARDPAARYPTPERAAQALHVFLAAGAEALPTVEAEPGWQPYLTWLESAGPNVTAPAEGLAELSAGLLTPAPAAAERPLKPVPVGQGGPVAARRGARSRSVKHRQKQANPIPPPTRSPVPAPVPAPPETAPAEEAKPFPPAPTPAPVEAPAPSWDVELVPALPMQQVAVSIRGLVLTRRDLLMLGLGAAGAAAAGLVGMALARLTSRKKRKEEG